MDEFMRVISLFGSLIRLLGLLVFGLSAAWFTLKAFNQPERRWQLQVAVFLGFFALAGLMARFTSPGGTGAFALGAGAGVIIWGLRAEREPGDEEEDEEDKEEE
jgi:hypothetical protein